MKNVRANDLVLLSFILDAIIAFLAAKCVYTTAKINDNKKLIDIEKELLSLNNTLKKSIFDPSKIKFLTEKLKAINLKLWNIENEKRLAEKNNNFDKNFIELARSVYKDNDKRSKIKLEINNVLGSNIKEVKSHY